MPADILPKPLLSFTSHLSCYRLVAFPTLSAGPVVELQSIELTANRSGGNPRNWSISCEDLALQLRKIIGKATTHELMECLRCGQIVQLPGTYTAYEVVRLGFRKLLPVRTGRPRPMDRR